MTSDSNEHRQSRVSLVVAVLVGMLVISVWLLTTRDKDDLTDSNRDRVDVPSRTEEQSSSETEPSLSDGMDEFFNAETKASSLLSTRRGYIDGILVDESGNAIRPMLEPDLPVELRPISKQLNEGRSFFTKLGNRGKFSFQEVPIGTYEVIVGATQSAGFVSRAKKPQRVSITNKANVAFVKVPFQLESIISGTVTDAAGATVGNAVIEFYSKNDIQLLRLRSALNGQFRAYHVPKDIATVVAWHPSQSPSKRIPFREGMDSVILQLAAGVIIEGVVVDDETNRPVSDFFLESGTFLTGDQDNSGRFHGTGDATRTRRLHVSATGYISAETPLPALNPGEKHTNIVVRLTPIGASTISGRVVDESGSGLSGVQLKFSREGPQSVQRGTRIFREIEFYTDDDGRFSFELESDYYKVTTTHYGYATIQQRVLVDSTPTDVGDISLPVSAEIHCRVLSSDSRLSGVQILTFPDEEKILSKVTVENGMYVFRQITPGKVLLRIRGPFTLTKPAIARAGEIAQVDIDLPRGSTHLEGFVAAKDRGRLGPQKMSISMRRKLPDDGTIEFTCTVEPDGFYSFRSAPPGEYDLEITQKVVRYNPNGFADKDTMIVHRGTLRIPDAPYLRKDFTTSI